MQSTCADPEGRTGGPDYPENHKAIVFLSNTGRDPLKITNLPSQQSMSGHYRPTSDTPFIMALRWRADDGPFQWFWIRSSSSKTTTKNNNNKKNLSKLDPL